MAGLNEQLPGGVPTGAPPPSVRPDYMDPSDVEGEFNAEPQPNTGQPIPRGLTTPVELADSSGSVPLPSRGQTDVQNLDTPPMPERGERAPGFTTGPLVPQNDSRYQDKSNIVIADVVMGGALPWIQAVADIALGRAPIERFDDVRREHEERIEALKSENPALVGAAENALPFLQGLGLGMMKPARTIAGAAARGATVGGATGAVQGATGGDPAEPTLSSERLAGAVGGAAKGAALGAVGSALPAGVAKGQEALAGRAAAKATADATAKATAQTEAAAKAKAAAQDKAKLIKQRAAEEKTRDDQLLSRFKSFRQVTGEPSKAWKENRKTLADDPELAFRKQAQFEPTLDSFSRMTNLPPVAIAQRLYGKGISPKTPGEQRLWQQLSEVDESWQAAKRRGATTQSPWENAPQPGQTPAAKPATPHAHTDSRSMSFDERVKSQAYSIDPLEKPMKLSEFTKKWNASKSDDMGGDLSQARLTTFLKDAGFDIVKVKGVNHVRSPDARSNSPAGSGRTKSKSGSAATEPAAGATTSAAGAGESAPASGSARPAAALPRPRKPADPSKLRVQPRTPVRPGRRKSKPGK